MATWAGPTLQEGVHMTAGAGAPTVGYLFAWTAAIYGVVLIVTGSKIAEPLRRLAQRVSPHLGYLLSCPMCFGCWTGAAADLSGLPLLTSAPSRAVSLVASAAAASALCWCCHVVLASLGSEEL